MPAHTASATAATPAPAEPDVRTLAFGYRRSPDQDAAAPVRHPVVIVGAGPVGLTLAIDLAQRAVPVVLLDNDHRLSTGSRAICFAKRTLEVFDRLGCGQRLVDKGVAWNVGRLFVRDRPVYQFDLLAEPGHERPAFVNLQQYHVEGFLVQRALQLPQLDLRWKNEVTDVHDAGDHVVLRVDTPDGPFELHAAHLIACDGSRSAVRRRLGLEAHGQQFRDRFLIVDVKMSAPFPAERWFWFDPPFHPKQSVLLHRQPDDVWRIDFQLGWDADPDEEKKPERIVPRVRALLGDDVHFTLEWASVYTFACQRLERFRHGRVLFAGDAAHGVSPFGARGANSGVQDADNLGWKLAAVLDGSAPETLLDSYAREREAAADENIRHSTRATDFITPKSEISRLFRDAVLALAHEHPFARALVNSGRLSTPTTLDGSALNTPDRDRFDAAALRPGAAAADAPLRDPASGAADWLLRRLGGDRFTLLLFDVPDHEARAVAVAAGDVAPLDVLQVVARGTQRAGTVEDVDGLLRQRYDLQAGSAYLFRPDQHVCARWRRLDATTLHAALRRALGEPIPPEAACP